MLLRSLWLKTIRDQRWAILGWGGGLGLLAIVTGVAWARAFPTQADRQILAMEMRSGLSGLQILYGQPVRIDTLGGFVAWRNLGFDTVLLALFTIITVTGATRGAEASGRVEIVATLVSSRTRMLLETLTGIGVSLVLACLLLSAGIALAGPIAGAPAVGVRDALLAVLDSGLVAALFGALACSRHRLRRRGGAPRCGEASC